MKDACRQTRRCLRCGRSERASGRIQAWCRIGLDTDANQRDSRRPREGRIVPQLLPRPILIESMRKPDSIATMSSWRCHWSVKGHLLTGGA